MNKHIFTYIFVFVALFLIGFYAHQEILLSNGKELRFSLENIYLFHAFFSGLICINLRFASRVDKLFPQLGFLYLATFVIKLLFFGIFFYNPLFTIEKLNFVEKISLIIPLFVFLVTEVIFVVKILNKKE